VAGPGQQRELGAWDRRRVGPAVLLVQADERSRRILAEATATILV
jgi:hypothetical protein